MSHRRCSRYPRHRRHRGYHRSRRCRRSSRRRHLRGSNFNSLSFESWDNTTRSRRMVMHSGGGPEAGRRATTRMPSTYLVSNEVGVERGLCWRSRRRIYRFFLLGAWIAEGYCTNRFRRTAIVNSYVSPSYYPSSPCACHRQNNGIIVLCRRAAHCSLWTQHQTFTSSSEQLLNFEATP